MYEAETMKNSVFVVEGMAKKMRAILKSCTKNQEKKRKAEELRETTWTSMESIMAIEAVPERVEEVFESTDEVCLRVGWRLRGQRAATC